MLIELLCNARLSSWGRAERGRPKGDRVTDRASDRALQGALSLCTCRISVRGLLLMTAPFAKKNHHFAFSFSSFGLDFWENNTLFWIFRHCMLFWDCGFLLWEFVGGLLFYSLFPALGGLGTRGVIIHGLQWLHVDWNRLSSICGSCACKDHLWAMIWNWGLLIEGGCDWTGVLLCMEVDEFEHWLQLWSWGFGQTNYVILGVLVMYKVT